MFIALEGIDTCGKGTQAKILAERYQAKLFKFPDPDSEMGKIVYAHLKKYWRVSSTGVDSPWNNGEKLAEVDAKVFQAVQLACRLEHAEAIKAELDAGKTVIADRYTGSGIVYGGADGIDMHYLDDIQKSLPQPDLQILLDIDPEDAAERMRGRGEELDRYEAKEGFMAEVAKRYRLVWQNKAATVQRELRTVWVIVDGRKSITEVAAEIIGHVKELRAFRMQDEHVSFR